MKPKSLAGPANIQSASGRLPLMLKPAATIAVFLALLPFGGCVEVTDLRTPEDIDEPSGQVDTGWTPDVFTTDLPPDQPCETAEDCLDWLDGRRCLVAACEALVCTAAPATDGLPCSDDNPATRGDGCQVGACEPGPAVCVCTDDAECSSFDDGNQCNGRLVCDGCSCVPMATPSGTACDDGNPATADDTCRDETTCKGDIPCQCDTVADCPTQACAEALCDECQCRLYAGVPGLIYEGTSPTTALPPGWTTSTDNPQVTWRSAGGGGLRATGADGTYAHGAATVELLSDRVALPPGAAVMRLEVALFSAETGCDDRLEIYANDTLVDTLCGSTSLVTRSWAIPGAESAQLRAVFISDETENAAAGAFVGDLLWLRSEPSNCPHPTAETVATEDSTGAQWQPTIAQLDSGFVGVWQDESGLYSREIMADATPTGPTSLLDSAGRGASGGSGWLVWERPASGDIVLSGGGSETVVPDSDPGRLPDVHGIVPAVTYIAQTTDGPLARLWFDDTFTDVSAVDPLLQGPRVVTGPDGAVVLIADSASVRLVRAVGNPEIVFAAQTTSRPAIAAGHGAVIAAVATLPGILIGDGTSSRLVGDGGVSSPALAATDLGWIVAWTVNGDGETGVAAAALPPDRSAAALLTAATYTFSDQDQIQLTSNGSDVLSAWRTRWMDGDDSGVVVRRIAFPLGVW
ncbi:MAG: hypothetical protein ACI9OJ_002411 [Myxococcota bacterium]